MRVLFVTRGLDLTEQALVISLRQAGVEIEVFSQPDNRGFNELERAGVPIRPIRFTSRLCLPAILQLRSAYQKSRVEVVHSVDGRALANCIWAAYGSSVKIVAYRGTLGSLRYCDPSALLTQLNPRVDRIICNCQAVVDYMAKKVNPAKLVRIYKGHDPAWYQFRQKADLRQFGIAAGAFVVGCIANSRPHKGIDLLIKAVQQLNHPNLHLLLIGEVSQRSLLALAAAGPAHSNIHFAGFRPDAPQIIGSCDLSVMASLREGFPRAVIEAALQRVPAVVSDVGGMPEIVKAGETGWVFPSGDVQRLAAALLEALQDRNRVRRFGEAAYQRVSRQFGLQQTISSTKKLYQDLLCQV